VLILDRMNVWQTMSFVTLQMQNQTLLKKKGNIQCIMDHLTYKLVLLFLKRRKIYIFLYIAQ